MNATTHLKRRKVFTPMDSNALVLIIEAFMMIFSLPQFPTFSSNVIIVRPSNQAIIYGAMFKYIFYNIFLV